MHHVNSYVNCESEEHLKRGRVDLKIFRSLYPVSNVIDFWVYDVFVHILIIAVSDFASSIIWDILW